MAPSTLERKDGAWLEGHAHEWVAAGLISPDQAASIKHFEHLDEPAAPQRLTVVTEVAAYVGAVLALMGGAAVVGPNWRDLGLVGQLAVAAALTVIGFTAGAWLVQLDETGTTRLGSFLWLVGTGGVGMAVAIVMDEIDPREESWIPLAIGVPVLAIGLGLWRNLDRPLQLLTGAAGFGLALGGLGGLFDAEPWLGGVVLLPIGALFALGAVIHRIEPHMVAIGAGALGAFIGGFMLGDLNQHLGPAIALLIAVTSVALALRERLVPLLVGGVIGSLIATEALLATTFTGAVASTIVTVIGLAIVVVVIARARRPV